jgi:hypothetical protein
MPSLSLTEAYPELIIVSPGYAFSMSAGSFWKCAQFWQIDTDPELVNCMDLKIFMH